MKKIIRVIWRLVIILIMLFITLLISNKVTVSKNISENIREIIVVSLISITVIVGVILFSNPIIKLSIKKRNKITKDKKDKEFSQLFERIDKECIFLKIYRKNAIKYILLMIICLLLTYIIAILFDFAIILLFTNLIIIYEFIKKYKKNKERYNQEFKKAVIKKMVNCMYPNLQYNYNGDDKMFETYRLVFSKNEEYNGYEISDYIYGKMEKDIDIQLCRISLINYYSDKTDDELNTLDTFLFSYNKINFSSPVMIKLKPNSYINSYKEDRVQMDSGEFEKYFDIFTESNIMAMQVLTHDVMEELVLFYLKYNCKFEIIIKDDHLSIKFLTGDVFSPSILKKTTDNDLLWTYYTILKFVINLCISLNKSLEGTEL